ncbi:hypothetical protein [Mycolicibacterium elephantis]|uniref:Uncharacterized protein n=1 Tax=Mycolicibacterium elephantis DSM 44368 TaxID=1335622 RepID=A0A439DQG6_9MYCO|nr:hypothetical protein [Mycolicibacterium elephantis]MCV7219493.1 hypothetical protein [Mycolicibacterium elephantis]RWA17929.1 hypothetical protein MELE44368_24690 [Mycolicibacterium elephantis DSM 44368]
MIKYEWRTRLDADEAAQLADLLDRAATYDAEPEYSTINFRDVERAMQTADSRIKLLVIWMLPHSTALGAAEEPERIAGLLRLVVDPDGSAQSAIVIDPRLRSIGITTLLLEQVGLDAAGTDGWLGTGAHTITAWAQGNHPAAGRLGDRFLIPRTQRVWKLIRSTECAQEATAAPVLEPFAAATADDTREWVDASTPGELFALREAGRVVGVIALDGHPVRSEEFGMCATITAVSAAPNAPAQARRRLLVGAAALAHEAGRSGVVVYVDSGDAAWVNACRIAGFQHDRTDVCFQFRGRR